MIKWQSNSKKSSLICFLLKYTQHLKNRYLNFLWCFTKWLSKTPLKKLSNGLNNLRTGGLSLHGGSGTLPDSVNVSWVYVSGGWGIVSITTSKCSLNWVISFRETKARIEFFLAISVQTVFFTNSFTGHSWKSNLTMCCTKKSAETALINDTTSYIIIKSIYLSCIIIIRERLLVHSVFFKLEFYWLYRWTEYLKRIMKLFNWLKT